MKQTNIVTPLWHNCKLLLEENKLEEADDKLMELIFKLSEYTLQGYKDESLVEGVKLETWKERAWYAIENAGLMDK